jgi:trigger factor
MQISLVHSEGLERTFDIAIPPDQIEPRISGKLRELAGRVRIDGFRPGKVPLRVVEKRYGSQVRLEVCQEAMEQAFRAAVVEKQLRPVGQPQLEPKSVADGQPLEFSARFEVYPEFEVQLPAHFEFKRPLVSITDNDLNVVIERIRDQQKTWREVERAAAKGDQTKIDFIGRIDDVPFEGGEATDYDLVLGSHVLVDDFETKLEGSKATETRRVSINFPTDYGVERLRGKNAQFDVTIKSVSEPILPELTGAFLAQFGADITSIDAFRSQVRRNVEREVASAVRAKLKDQVIELLLKSVRPQLPRVLVQSEIASRITRLRAQFANSGLQPDIVNVDPARHEEAAKRSVALGLIVAQILSKNAISVTPNVLRQAVEERAATYDEPSAVLSWY